jgi:hypothetical protein
VGASANIQLRYDVTSFPAYTGSSTTRSQLRVVEFEGGMVNKWSQRGLTVSGNATAGTVSTTTPVTQNDFVFSLGAIGLTATIDNTAPIAICDNEEVATIPVSFSGTPPFVLNYRTTGTTTTNYTATTNNPTYNILLRGEDMGGYSATPYTLSLTSFTANGIVGIVSPATVEITVKLTHKPDISGSTAVALNETRPYSTENHAGSTYSWGWTGSSGGAITPTGNQASIFFNAGTGTYTLRVTEISSSGCSAIHEIVITVNNTPVPSITPTTANVCEGLTETYSTNYTAANEYFWTVVGGSCTGCGSWVGDKAEITVTWNSVGDASVQVTERIKVSPLIFGTATNNLYVYPMPTQRILDGDQICIDQQGSIIVQATELGFTYQLRRSSDDSNIGAFLAGNSGNRSFLTGNLTTTTGFNVLAYNLGCQLRMPAVGDVTVIVEEPEITLLSDDVDQIICTGSLVEFSAANTGSHPATQFNFFINNLSKQDGASPTYSLLTLANHDTIKVVGTTAKGCVDTSNVITVSVGDQIWSGAVSGVWNTLGNWACPDIPTIAKDVTVPQKATHMPEISADAAVLNLTIESGASLTHDGGIFSIAGDIINNGTFATTAQITLTEENNQNLSGSSGISLNTLVVDKNAGDVTLGTSVNVNSGLTLTSGIINTSLGNLLTLNNGATSSSGNATSFINGTMRKVGNSGFVFPIGGSGRWARIETSEIDGGSPSTEFVATYIHSPYSNVVDRVPTLNNVSEVEYWDLSNPTTDVSCNVTLYWEDVARSNINISELADLRVAHFDGSQWNDQGNGSVSASGSSGSIKTFVKLASFSPITFGSADGSNPLPVELINFKVSVSNGSTVLSWSTASEHNNSHFEIERSANMDGFISLGRTNSKAPNGNSSQVIDYLFTDNNPILGENYYRLKQVDFDGKFAYSSIVTATVDVVSDFFGSISFYPNPTNGRVTLKMPASNETITISIYNANGSLLADFPFNPMNPTLDLTSYHNGIFLIKVSKDDKYSIHRVVKQ